MEFINFERGGGDGKEEAGKALMNHCVFAKVEAPGNEWSLNCSGTGENRIRPVLSILGAGVRFPTCQAIACLEYLTG